MRDDIWWFCCDLVKKMMSWCYLISFKVKGGSENDLCEESCHGRIAILMERYYICGKSVDSWWKWCSSDVCKVLVLI